MEEMIRNHMPVVATEVVAGRRRRTRTKKKMRFGSVRVNCLQIAHEIAWFQFQHVSSPQLKCYLRFKLDFRVLRCCVRCCVLLCDMFC